MNRRGMGVLQVIMACLVVLGLAYMISQTLDDSLSGGGDKKAAIRDGSNAEVAQKAVDAASAAAKELNARNKKLKCTLGEGGPDCPP